MHAFFFLGFLTSPNIGVCKNSKLDNVGFFLNSHLEMIIQLFVFYLMNCVSSHRIPLPFVADGRAAFCVATKERLLFFLNVRRVWQFVGNVTAFFSSVFLQANRLPDSSPCHQHGERLLLEVDQ